VTDFADSYLGRLRSLVGPRLLLVPGARVVIENEAGEILLQKRSDLGVWGLPGGNAEAGEDLKSVAIREVREETGLSVGDIKPFGFGGDPALETIRFPNGDECQFFVLNFFTRTFQGELRISDGESLSLGWFRLGTMPELLPNMKASILAYELFKETGDFQMMGAL
jgi:ADP-ribose pyrophosphatase YjhB (NUDIX family)